jgi:hypothetical protein
MRDKLIQVRVSEEEKAQIAANAKAAGMTPAAWLRELGLRDNPGTLPDKLVPRFRPPDPTAIIAEQEFSTRFHCPVLGCAFRAGSAAARCSVHGRTVVP